MFELSIIVVALGGLYFLLLHSTSKVATLLLMCFSDRVNLVNMVVAFAAFDIKLIFSGISEWASIITPIVIFISAVIVLGYNVLKFLNQLNKNNDE